VAIDYSALLGLAAGIQVAKADYDFARDGGAVGRVPLHSEIIPTDSILLAFAAYFPTPMAFATNGVLNFYVGPDQIGYAQGGETNLMADWFTGALPMITTTDRPIEAAIVDDVCTAGKAQLWVFYLPT
jgi:hypothetical protein